MRDIYLEDVYNIFIYNDKIDFLSYSEVEEECEGNNTNTTKKWQSSNCKS